MSVATLAGIAACVQTGAGIYDHFLEQLAFHAGLDTMRTFSEFAVTASLSIAMWLLIPERRGAALA